jgi:hypothetical protein
MLVRTVQGPATERDNPMQTNHNDLKTEMKETMAQLRALRDEAKLKIHLASMDARTTWNALEPKLQEAERSAEQATASALASVQQTVTKLRHLVKSL